MKLRRKRKHIRDGNRVKPVYAVEGYHDGIWAPVGIADGTVYFETEEEREAAYREINELVNGE